MPAPEKDKFQGCYAGNPISVGKDLPLVIKKDITMNWTKNFPTKPGYYFCRTKNEVLIGELYNLKEKLGKWAVKNKNLLREIPDEPCFSCGFLEFYPSAYNYDWARPIELPKEN